MLREISRRARVMYVSICAATGTAFPRRTTQAISALFEGEIDKRNSGNYVLQLSKRFERCAISALAKLPAPGQGDELSAPLFPSERLSSIVWNFADCDDPSLVAEAKAKENELVILVLDEARSTLSEKVEDISQFRLIRKSLAEFALRNPNRRFLAVFVDTSSRIQNFAPSALAQPSRRASILDRELVAPKLYPPFILRDSFDVNFHPCQIQGSDLSSLVNCREYLNAGRPLVSRSTVSSMVTNAISQSDDYSDFLWLKLNGGQTKLTQIGALSMMLWRLGACVHPSHPYATEMVANNMATLLEADHERETMLVAYVPEPKLAIAAAESWGSENVFCTNLVPALQNAFFSGVLDQGERGEVVSQIIWLQAFDKACRKEGKSVGECIEIEKVLGQLIPMQCDTDLSKIIPDHLSGAKVACCQFVQIFDFCGPATRAQAAQRHCGIRVKVNQVGIDLAFPIMDDSAMILCQTKNRIDQQTAGKFSRDCCQKMKPSFVFSDAGFTEREIKDLERSCVRVYMQLGATTAAVFCEEDGGSSCALQLFGMEARCLSPSIRASLVGLLNGRVKLQDFVRFKHSKRGPTEPSPDSEDSILSAWPFFHEPG